MGYQGLIKGWCMLVVKSSQNKECFTIFERERGLRTIVKERLLRIIFRHLLFFGVRNQKFSSFKWVVVIRVGSGGACRGCILFIPLVEVLQGWTPIVPWFFSQRFSTSKIFVSAIVFGVFGLCAFARFSRRTFWFGGTVSALRSQQYIYIYVDYGWSGGASLLLERR